MKHLLFLIFAVQACLPGFAACDGRVRIVPRPAEVEELPGSFRLTSRTPVVITDERLRTPAEIFARAVGKLTGTEPAVTAVPEKHAVTLQLQPGYEAEEYLLEVGRQRITVTASTPQAVLHGLRSLQQLVAGGEIPACVVRDKPTFAYRGAMLDVCRHFFPVEDVKTYIDILSLHKINKFHWHLTDDQGWRIEIKKYPLLTQIGSRRAETLVGRYDKNKEGVYDGKPYGGFYTQEEIREIVSYAAERHIEVIPEIEMPGHGLAALTAYPWLGCTGGPYAVWTHWGISDDVYCAGKETTFEFIEKVLTEVLALFPSKLIHIGGDECPKGRWKACPLCQQRIRCGGLPALRIAARLCGRIELLLGGALGADPVLNARIARGHERHQRVKQQLLQNHQQHEKADHRPDEFGDVDAQSVCLPYPVLLSRSYRSAETRSAGRRSSAIRAGPWR